MNNNILKFIALDNSDPVTYDLDISPAEARYLLESAAEAEGKYFFTKRFPLRFNNDRDFQLYHVRNRNSWRRILTASLQNQGNGTQLNGQFKVSAFVMAFTSIWLMMAFGSTIFLLVSGGLEMIGALLFPVFGIALPHIGRAMTKSDERAVLELLDKAFIGHISHKNISDYSQ